MCISTCDNQPSLPSTLTSTKTHFSALPFEAIFSGLHEKQSDLTAVSDFHLSVSNCSTSGPREQQMVRHASTSSWSCCTAGLSHEIYFSMGRTAPNYVLVCSMVCKPATKDLVASRFFAYDLSRMSVSRSRSLKRVARSFANTQPREETSALKPRVSCEATSSAE